MSKSKSFPVIFQAWVEYQYDKDANSKTKDYLPSNMSSNGGLEKENGAYNTAFVGC